MSNHDHNIQAPLVFALAEYADKRNASFHVPGHKDGRVLCNRPEGDRFYRQIAQIDGTEITGLDDLHHPEGVIAEAQERAARLFGAEASYFLVGGSTAGNLGLILTVCSAPGDVLLVQRNVHKSVIHGLMLAGAKAVFLAPEADPASGLSIIPSADTVREALRRYPDAKGLLVTHPNYYGMGGDLAALAELCHGSGVPLLVDEAHGAHFGLHPELPGSALAAGADGVVQSTHKMLSALTMGAMLHVQGSLIDRELLRQRLAMVQSSSPSYPIMASLDLSRSYLEEAGPAAFAEGLRAADKLREHIRKLNRFKLIELPADEKLAGCRILGKQHNGGSISEGKHAVSRLSGEQYAGCRISDEKQANNTLSAEQQSRKTTETEQYAGKILEIGQPTGKTTEAEQPAGDNIEIEEYPGGGIEDEGVAFSEAYQAASQMAYPRAYQVQDPFKVIISDNYHVYSGYELQERLEQAGCIPEMSDPTYVVLALSLGTTEEDVDRLVSVLETLDQEVVNSDLSSKGPVMPSGEQNHLEGNHAGQISQDNFEPEQIYDPNVPSVASSHSYESSMTDTDLAANRIRGQASTGPELETDHRLSTWNIPAAGRISEAIAFNMKPINREDTEAVPVEYTGGRIAAEMVIPYPPGIPILYPGELITKETAELLQILHKSQAKCQGTEDPSMKSIRVYK
nr:aminotransferase class I/II-fold pyridoxal phosphate-dependent enzyme [Paenibacillus tuaregi]